MKPRKLVGSWTEEVTEDWTELRKEEPDDLWPSIDFIRILLETSAPLVNRVTILRVARPLSLTCIKKLQYVVCYIKPNMYISAAIRNHQISNHKASVHGRKARYMCLINCEPSLAHKFNPTSGYTLIKVHAHSYPSHYSLYCIFTRLRLLLISGHIYHLHAPKNSLGIVFVSLSPAFTYGLIYILEAFLSPNSAVTCNDVFSFYGLT